MFRFVPRRLAVGAYSMFMIEQKNNPKLQGLPIAERGRITGKLYKSLTPSEKAALESRAAAYTFQKKGGKAASASPAKAVSKKPMEPPKPRRPSAYAAFVKENIHKFDRLPQRDRMKAVAKLWKQQQQRTGH